MKDYNNAAFLSFAAARGLVKRGFEAKNTFVKDRPNLAEIVNACLPKDRSRNELNACFQKLKDELAKVDDGKTIRILDETSSFCPAGSLVRPLPGVFQGYARRAQFLSEISSSCPQSSSLLAMVCTWELALGKFQRYRNSAMRS